MQTRRMRWWDIEEVVGLERDLFEATAWTAAQFWSELAQRNRWYVVAENDAGLLGYAGLMANAPIADVQTIAVAEFAQGRGVGRALLQELIATARERACSEILLEVRADNEPAIALYERAGFVPIAQRTSYYGPGSHALVMRRRPT